MLVSKSHRPGLAGWSSADSSLPRSFLRAEVVATARGARPISVDEMIATGGAVAGAGVIALDRAGRIAAVHRTPTMAFAAVRDDGRGAQAAAAPPPPPPPSKPARAGR